MVNRRTADRISKISKDTAHGASWLTRQAISILSLAAKESYAETTEQFIEEMRQTAFAIAKARPSIVSIVNYANSFLIDLMRAGQQKDLGALKSYATAKGLELITVSRQAFLKTIEYASAIIKDNDAIATCSYSSTVCQTLAAAKHKDTNFRVLIAESRVDSTSYGETTAIELARHSIPTEIFADNSISRQVAKASKSIIGADAVTASGYIVNGTPSLRLAQASRNRQVPFYVVCETAKFDLFGYLGECTEPGFDSVPLSICTAVITEKGTMRPDLVVAYIQQKSEEMVRLFSQQGLQPLQRENRSSELK